MKSVINKLTNTKTGLDTFPLRLATGAIFTAHGAQKLFGWFGGYGLEGTASWMTSIGLEPGLLMATMAGSAELIGGLLLIMGLMVRPAALILALTMIVAIVSVHLQNGFFISNNGFEFALVLLAVNVGLFFRGAGSLSADLTLRNIVAQ